MSWFDTASLTTFAKTALTQAQKSIDKVLDIDEEGSDAKQDSTGLMFTINFLYVFITALADFLAFYS